jgi:hypothetical protein
MSIPLLDIHIKYLVDYTIKVVRSNPDKYLKEIFGDARLSPHDNLYGNRLLDSAKKWIETTKINTVLGYDLSQVELPAVTVNLAASSPSEPFIGDMGDIHEEQINSYDQDIIVEDFQAKSMDFSSDRTFIYFELKDDMDPMKAELVIPGLHLRDGKDQEFLIGFDDCLQKLTISELSVPLSELDASVLRVVSPLKHRRYRGGVMQFQDTVSLAVHTHQSRMEGVYLWAIVVWGLLKFRPLLIETFGYDLAVPSSSDLAVDPSYMGNAVWVRQVTLTGKTVWSWEGPRLQDVIGMLLIVNAGRKDDK